MELKEKKYLSKIIDRYQIRDSKLTKATNNNCN